MHIVVQTWGTAGIGEIRVRVQPDESAVETAVRSYCRRTGLSAWRNLCSQGTALSHGHPESHHYSVAVGTYCRDGSLSVGGQLWLSVPVGC